MLLKKSRCDKTLKRAWWKQKSERIAQHEFGVFRTSLASRRSSFVLEPDYAQNKEAVI